MWSPSGARSGRWFLPCLTPASFLHVVTSQARLSGHHTSRSPPSLMHSLHLCHCTHVVARRPGQRLLGHLGDTSITAAATDSYLVQLHLIRRPPPSSWAAGALIRWHNHDVVPPGKEESVSTGPSVISLAGHRVTRVICLPSTTCSSPCPLSSKRVQ